MGKRIFPVIGGLLLLWCQAGCKGEKKEVATSHPLPSPLELKAQCDGVPGPARVERVSERVWVALGFDLANVALIHTLEGNIIVDAGMSPAKALEIKSALEREAPSGPVKALIYTHSHIDHVGGASIWVEEGTQIWATEGFSQHLLKQYGLFREAERRRGLRQFGMRVDLKSLPCSAIGPRPDMEAAEKTGVLFPTNFFRGRKEIQLGGLRLDLVEAHGETHDHLFVWIPEDRTLLCGDNFYWSFPNLYTLRGTSPRPVEDWIQSLDSMRSLGAEHLVPGHTRPVHGKEEIATVLRDYRDAIQWVRDEVVRGANLGLDMDTLVEEVKLPPHLAKQPQNRELYGQVDWSVRAVYTNNLGWFDERAQRLYPLSHVDAARREVQLMGGPQKLLNLAAVALEEADPRWAIHLLSKLKESGLAQDKTLEELKELLAASYERLAQEIPNSNGRGYLLESVQELRQGILKTSRPAADPRFLEQIPLPHLFSLMSTALAPEKAMDLEECLAFVFPDEARRFNLTVRRGIAEVWEGEPLPGTPEPLAVLTMNSVDFRRILFKLANPASLYLKGRISVQGSWLQALAFLTKFRLGAEQ